MRATSDGREIVSGGAIVTKTAVFTPAAAAYLANDIIEGAKEFALIGPLGGGDIIINRAELLVSHTALISGEAAYRLQLYSVTPPSALADNAAWDLPSGDRASYQGFIDFAAPTDVGSSLYVQTLALNYPVTVGPAGSLFAYLQTIGPFTATAAARTVKLRATWP